MNLLFDFLNLVVPTGGAEYARTVFFRMMERIKAENRKDVQVFALYDSERGIFYPDMREDSILPGYPIKYVDICNDNFVNIVTKFHIDRFFVSSSHNLCLFYPEFGKVQCEVISVTHDLHSEEQYNSQLAYYLKFIRPKYHFENRNEPKWMIYFRLKDSTPKLVRWLIHVRRDRVLEGTLRENEPFKFLIKNNPKVTNIVVSEYTKTTMIYDFDISPENIKVLWSPERIYQNARTEIENEVLRELIQSGNKFYLMVSADRQWKNPHKAIQAFKKYASLDKDAHLLAIGYESALSDNMHTVPWLSDSDLANAYKYCYALLYPTFFEGFGYPPLEAMHYGKPVLCSNATSMPEIYGDAPVWFCPLYESAIFQALMSLNSDNYQHYVQKSINRYREITERQERDLQTLIDLIIAK